MNVLIACEESQAVCIAFRKRGHCAFSCDLQNCSGGFPEWHIISDCLVLINGNCTFMTCDGVEHYVKKWDIIIAHPPCTYLSRAGSHILFKCGVLNEERYKKGLAARDFFMKFFNANCDRICIENPIPNKIYNLPHYSQIIQPYYFNHPYTKSTCLWLKGLPNLVLNYNDVYNKSDLKSWVYSTSSAKIRSKTFHGIAEAMAEQFSNNQADRDVIYSFSQLSFLF